MSAVVTVNDVPYGFKSQPTRFIQNVSTPMSQYLSAFGLLLMVISPVLIPAIITVVHRANVVLGVFADRRRTARAASLA